MSNFVSVVDLQDLVGKDIDFFLENDFFEIEGIVKKENEQFILEILGRIPDNHKLAEKIYEIELKNNKVYLKTPDEQDFEIFINKIYETIDNPTKEQLIALNDQGINEFFRKSDDTIIAYDDDLRMWLMTVFKDELSGGDVKSYTTLGELYEQNCDFINGKWEAIHDKFETWHP